MKAACSSGLQELRNALRWWREFGQEQSDNFGGLNTPSIDEHTLINRHVAESLAVHLKVRFQAGSILAHVNTYEFCADLCRHESLGRSDLSNRATANLSDFVVGETSGPGDHEMKGAVLVVIGETRQIRKRIGAPDALSDAVRLIASNDCEVCAAGAGEPLLVLPAPRGVGQSEGEVDLSLVRGTDPAPALVDGPSDVIEGSPEVLDDIAELQRPQRRDRVNLGNGRHETVTVRLVFRCRGDECVSAAISGPLGYVSLEGIGVAYCPQPLPPGAIEIARDERSGYAATSEDAT